MKQAHMQTRCCGLTCNIGLLHINKTTLHCVKTRCIPNLAMRTYDGTQKQHLFVAKCLRPHTDVNATVAEHIHYLMRCTQVGFLNEYVHSNLGTP